MSNKRIHKIKNEVNELDIIKEDKYKVEIRDDRKGKTLGMSIIDKGIDGDVVWVEDTKEGIQVDLNPIYAEDTDSIELWTILYCIASVVIELDKDKYYNYSSGDLAEDFYDGILDPNLHKDEEPLKGKDNDYFYVEPGGGDGLVEDYTPGELSFNLHFDELAKMVLGYPEEYVGILTQFINELSVVGGEDLVFEIIDEEGNSLENGYLPSTTTGLNREKARELVGVMEPNYVNHHLSVLIDSILNSDIADKDTLMFLNQLIYERTSIEWYIQEMTGKE